MNPWTVLGWILVVLAASVVVAIIVGVINSFRDQRREKNLEYRAKLAALKRVEERTAEDRPTTGLTVPDGWTKE